MALGWTILCRATVDLAGSCVHACLVDDTRKRCKSMQSDIASSRVSYLDTPAPTCRKRSINFSLAGQPTTRFRHHRAACTASVHGTRSQARHRMLTLLMARTSSESGGRGGRAGTCMASPLAVRLAGRRTRAKLKRTTSWAEGRRGRLRKCERPRRSIAEGCGDAMGAFARGEHRERCRVIINATARERWPRGTTRHDTRRPRSCRTCDFCPFQPSWRTKAPPGRALACPLVWRSGEARAAEEESR